MIWYDNLFANDLDHPPELAHAKRTVQCQPTLRLCPPTNYEIVPTKYEIVPTDNDVPTNYEIVPTNPQL